MSIDERLWDQTIPTMTPRCLGHGLAACTTCSVFCFVNAVPEPGTAVSDETAKTTCRIVYSLMFLKQVVL